MENRQRTLRELAAPYLLQQPLCIEYPNLAIDYSDLEDQISALTTFVRHFVAGQLQAAKVCGICSTAGHPTGMCLILQKDLSQQADVVGGFLGPSQSCDRFTNSYNPGWGDHPNLSYGSQGSQQIYSPQSSNSGMSLEDLVKDLAINTHLFQQETRAGIQNLENKMSQLATSISKLEAQNSEKLPSQIVVTPIETVSAIMLTSGKELESKPSFSKKTADGKIIEDDNAAKFENSVTELCTDNVELKSDEKTSAGENVSPIFKRNWVKKYNNLGVVGDVMVQANELIFLEDFYILSMEDETTTNSIPLLFGRQFMKISKTKIDVDEGTLSVEFDGELVKFNIFDAKKYPNEFIDSIVQDFFEDGYLDEFEWHAQLDTNVELAKARGIG